MLNNLDAAFEQILDPHAFIKNFPNMEHFREWACDRKIRELRETILVFERAELYAYCAVMQKLIDDLV